MQIVDSTLNILLVEDSEDDLALILLELRKNGLKLNHLCVDTAESMIDALDSLSWDLVLSDYNLPNFSGAEALNILKLKDVDIPFIIVSGAIGEETAVQIMRSGAHDYIMKDNLARLVPAIERELREADVRVARRIAEDDLRLAAKVFESSVEGIVITDAKAIILRVNQAFTDITGYTQEQAIGKSTSILQSGRHDHEFYRHLWTSLSEHGYWQGEVWNRRKNGEIYPEWLTISAVFGDDNEVTHYIGGFIDLSRQKQAEERIQHLIHYDALTDLPNRLLFRFRIKQPMVKSLQRNRRVALLHLDLVKFVTINDTLGHQVGDRLLHQVGRRLASNVHDSDIVARIGGDEFAVACPYLDRNVDVAAIAQSVMNTFSEPFWIDGREIFLNPSIGIALFPDDSEDYDELAKYAGTAMQHAKRQHGTYQFYHTAMNLGSTDKLNMENALRKALDRQEFCLYFQPQIELNTNKIVGAEALLRWNLSSGEVIMPTLFIPMLEENGMIISVGEWVLRSACYKLKELKKAGFDDMLVAVNLSPLQFRHKDLVGMVQTVLAETCTDPSMLEIEITETSVMEDPENTQRILTKLHDMGIRIAIDDFGTGYSSLSHLRRFPIDVLKIDRSFVMDISQDKDDEAIVETIIAMAHRLNIRVIAEGIENQLQLDFLKKHGCEIGQGYYFSRPVPMESFTKKLLLTPATAVDA